MTLPRATSPWLNGPRERIPAAKRTGEPDETTQARALIDAEARALDSYWRAANYLSVGQIYLLDNPLLTEGPDSGPSHRGP
jgi:hypothetical protein